MTSIRDALTTELAHVRQFTPDDVARERDIEAAIAALPDEAVVELAEPAEVETTAVEAPETAVVSSGKARKPAS
jgi:hypothetical protein